MSIFVDTSALYAILDRDDLNHVEAAGAWLRLLHEDESLLTTNYVVLETMAITQNRLGMPAVRSLVENVLPVLAIEWIKRDDHDQAVKSLIRSGRRKVSLVDYTSFVTMQRVGIRTAFAFDRHFVEQGFRLAK